MFWGSLGFLDYNSVFLVRILHSLYWEIDREAKNVCKFHVRFYFDTYITSNKIYNFYILH